MPRYTKDHKRTYSKRSSKNSNTSSTSSANSIEVKRIKGCNVYDALRTIEDPFMIEEAPRVSMVKEATPSTSTDVSLSQVSLDTVIRNIDLKIDSLNKKLDTYNGRLLLVEHKIGSIEDEQEMLRSGQETLMEETNRLKEEDASLHNFCKSLSKDVTDLRQDITNINGSYVGFHHSRCVVFNNLNSKGKEDPRRIVQNLINKEMQLVGIEVMRVKVLSQRRGLFLIEPPSLDQCRAVLKKKKTVNFLRNSIIFISAAKSTEVLNVERSLKSLLQLILVANEYFKFIYSRRLIKEHQRNQLNNRQTYSLQQHVNLQEAAASTKT